LICSPKEETKLRENAIEALFLIEAKEPGKSPAFAQTGKLFSDEFAALPTELRKTFLEHAFSAKASKRTKLSFINLLDLNKKSACQDVKDFIRTSTDASLAALLTEHLLNKETWKDVKVACAEMLVDKQAVACAPSILAALKANNVRDNEYLVDRLVDMLNKLGVSGPEVEDVLVEKLDQIGIGDERSSIRIALFGLSHREKEGWELDPNKRIIEALSRVGGKKALIAMFKKFSAVEENRGNRLPSVDEATDKAINQRVAMDTMLTMTQLMQGLSTIEKRLKASGEMNSMFEIEGVEDFMKKHGYR